MARHFLGTTALAGATLLAIGATPALAQDATNTTSAAPVAAEPVTSSSDDIVVTATKRKENLRDVAMPISAVTGEQLAKANANSLSDYIVRLPGVVFNDYQPGVSEVVIRGIAATTYHEQGQTTVGYYLNEIPLVEPGFPIGIPDVDTFDLDRVEVLRGPQGTLFGSSTLGGLVNYVVKTADTHKIEAAGEGLVSSTENSHGDVNYAAKLMLNVPIIKDTLAVRVMALQRYDAGYLDNTGTGDKGSNDFRTRGLRGSIVLTPAVGTKLTYLGVYQESKLSDQTYLTSPTKLERFSGRNEPQSTSFQLHSLRLDQDLGFANLTVFGSVNEKKNTTVFSYPYAYVTGVTTGQAAAYSLGEARANIKQVEARLASSGNGPVRWLVGASYMTAKKYSYDQIFQQGAAAYINANRAQFGGYSGAQLTPNDRLYGYISDTFNKDLGIFGELSWRPVDQFEVTVGGRYYDTQAKATVTNQAGALGGYPGGYTPVGSTGRVNRTENGFTPKATISFRPVPGFLAYMTYSKGFRVGGINPNAGLLATIPASYDSDKVDNYEAGVKFGLFANRLLIDATVFTIDWKNIQARLFGPAPSYYSYVTNAGSANIGGVEFSGTLKLTRALTFSSNVTYQEAKLTAFLPDTFALNGGYASGTTLPGSSKWSVANNLVLDLPDKALAPTFEIAHRYISSAPVAFGNTNTRGNFSQFDARASVTVMEKVRLLGFVNNIFDKRGILNAPFTDQAAPAYSIIRPRTYGLRVDVGF
ncbi:TonB-dependent receptor [Sphingomonas glacialis]|uniref:TonB-dependent receptor n=1 Tax=Sphingomonas glacialis TaxID=658225 RepID=A0A502FCT9_9SPHN|nr:TonB-dependent receptor [Sphingomonas glacialis]TPG47113.1 TonB-dependent receptor [Sphingomonas glacialis]